MLCKQMIPGLVVPFGVVLLCWLGAELFFPQRERLQPPLPEVIEPDKPDKPAPRWREMWQQGILVSPDGRSIWFRQSTRTE